MGKNGDMLRWMKAQKSSYTFTRAQLEEHDRQVREDAIRRKRKDLETYARGIVAEDFEERTKLLTGSTEDVTLTVFSMLISISCKVLVEQFGWKPIWRHSTRRNRLSRFVVAVQQETEELINNEELDIRKYAKKAYDITGVRFEAGEEVEDNENS